MSTPVFMVRYISFEEIVPYWKQLWPDHIHIPKFNNRNFLKNTYFTDEPKYIGYYAAVQQETGIIAGVNSVYARYGLIRTRGLYVLPEWRDKGVGSLLLGEIDYTAHALKCSISWGYPRLETINFWRKHGWIRTEGVLTDMQYGPHVWALKSYEL